MSRDDWRLTAHAVDTLGESDAAEIQALLAADQAAAAYVDDVVKLDDFARTQLARRDLKEGAADGMRPVTGPWDTAAAVVSGARRWRWLALAATALVIGGVALYLVQADEGGGAGPGPVDVPQSSAQLRIQVHPSTAQVTVDGKALDGAFDVKLNSTVRIVAVAPGYRRYERNVRIDELSTNISVKLARARERARFVLDPRDDRVEVWVDGTRLGVGPQPLERVVGERLTVRLVAPDGRSLEQPLEVVVGLGTVQLELPPAPEPAPPTAPDVRDAVATAPSGQGKLRINAKPWARILIDGKPVGITPRTIELPAGRHKVTLTKGSMSTTKSITVKSNETKRVFHTFAP